MDGVMTSAAQALSADDIDVLADYLAGLPVTGGR
jgi:cytochrome c553